MSNYQVISKEIAGKTRWFVTKGDYFIGHFYSTEERANEVMEFYEQEDKAKKIPRETPQDAVMNQILFLINELGKA